LDIAHGVVKIQFRPALLKVNLLVLQLNFMHGILRPWRALIFLPAGQLTQ